ncbi:MAG: hypothetical protein ACQESR_13160 [Planctomycetota bacterium]
MSRAPSTVIVWFCSVLWCVHGLGGFARPALAYPRPITFIGKMPAAYERTRQIYEKLGVAERIRVVANSRQWRPLSKP